MDGNPTPLKSRITCVTGGSIRTHPPSPGRGSFVSECEFSGATSVLCCNIATGRASPTQPQASGISRILPGVVGGHHGENEPSATYGAHRQVSPEYLGI